MVSPKRRRSDSLQPLLPPPEPVSPPAQLDAYPFWSLRSVQRLRWRWIVTTLLLLSLLMGLSGWWGRRVRPSWIDSERFTQLGPYSPYQPARDAPNYSVPKGFEVDQVSILHRHGSRSPTDAATHLIQNALAKLRASPLEASELPSDWQFVQEFSFGGFGSGEMTDYGRREGWTSGRESRERYGHLEPGLWVRSSGMNRTTETGRFFLQGFKGKEFDLNAGDEEKLDMVIPSKQGWNSSLSVQTCAADKHLSPNPGHVAEHAWVSTYAPSLTQKLNDLFQIFTIEPFDVVALMSLCGFDSVMVSRGRRSPWCDVFNEYDWQANEYFYDLSKYYYQSYGAPFGRTKGASWVNELIARLTNSKTVVQGGASNLTLISPPGGERLFVDMSHDNTMVSILAALRVMKDDTPLPLTPSTIPEHRFQVGQIVPFAGRFVFERLRSKQKGTQFLRMLINDKPVLWESQGKVGVEVISVQEFVRRMEWAQKGGDWERCLDWSKDDALKSEDWS